MKSKNFDYKFILAGAVLLLAQGGIAQAGETVTVEGPYTITRTAGGENISVSRVVSYSDLDLGGAQGVDVLKDRVQETARDVCEQIDRRFPMAGSERAECVRVAARDALHKVNVIVASRDRATRVAALH